ncbi:hypothetical protein B0H17DRAFT_340133, partial [Mycena rosella]
DTPYSSLTPSPRRACRQLGPAPAIPYLDLLPVELWLACWALCSLRQLRRISLVCRLFRALALSFVFEHQSFDVAALTAGLSRDNWMDRVRHLHRTAVRIDRLVEAPYAPLIRSWKAVFKNVAPMVCHHTDIQNIHLFDSTYHRVVMTFSTTLVRYDNLSSVHMERFNLDAAFRKTLLSIPRLQDLTLCGCNVDARDGFLGLRSWTISGGGRGGDVPPLQIASPNTLCDLHLARAIETSRLILGFGPRKLPELVNLSIDMIRSTDIDLVFRFLHQCPRLESLEIDSIEGQLPLPAVHMTAIPLLRSLTGPQLLLQLLAPNRPIYEAKFRDDKKYNNDPQELMLACMDISRSASPLHYLTLPATTPTLELLISITRLFPDLKELSITMASRPSFRCGTGRFNHHWEAATNPLDRRSVELIDEDAFADPRTEDVSDTEPEDLPTISPTTLYIGPKMIGRYSSVIIWIFDGELSLPANIEVFRVEDTFFANDEQVIATLGVMYPRLRQIQYGSVLNRWERTGALWKG